MSSARRQLDFLSTTRRRSVFCCSIQSANKIQQKQEEVLLLLVNSINKLIDRNYQDFASGPVFLAKSYVSNYFLIVSIHLEQWLEEG